MEARSRSQNVFNQMEDIGVIWALDEAAKLGYQSRNSDWVNFGQGEPEVGQLEGGVSRINRIEIQPDDDKYGPVNGTDELRKAIADYYNRLYRKNKVSKYTAKNVSIAMGGRMALNRIFTILGSIRLGYKTPEYPAYHDLFNLHLKKITPVYFPTRSTRNFSMSPSEFRDELKKYKPDAFLLSNPCNPTGHVMKNEELSNFVKTAKEECCTLIIDEFYSHFIYEKGKPASEPVSSAAFVENVNSDNVLIVDGLTKSFRYPGWRLAWVLAPESVIENIGRAASAIDGGPSVPIQRAALQLFEPASVDQETKALREVFSRKQNRMAATLRENGMICSDDANGTFYVWADISKLPPPINDSKTFFLAALKQKVITVPGYMFDIHPGSQKVSSEFNHYVRFSFGANEESLVKGLTRISELVNSYRKL